MLSSIGRAAIRRVGAGASHQSTNPVLRSLWHLQRVHKSNSADSSSSLREFALALRRSYATTTKAVKAKPKTSTKAKARSTTQTAAPKAVKKAVKKKPKKKVVAKPKPKRKVLTEVQKQKAELQKQKAELKALKATALTPPKGKPSTAWRVLFSESIAKDGNGVSNSSSISKDAAAKYKSLTTQELEHYNHIANQNKIANETAYKNWIDSHTPEEIRLANNARNVLKKKEVAKGALKKGSRKFQLLEDPRIPKRPVQAWTQFASSRWNSGDLKGIKISDATPQIVKEWKELSPGQRKVFEDQHTADLRRYAQEYKTVFGREPLFIQDQQKATA